MSMEHALPAASPSWLERHRRHLLWLVVAMVVVSAFELGVASFLDGFWIGLLIAAAVAELGVKLWRRRPWARWVLMIWFALSVGAAGLELAATADPVGAVFLAVDALALTALLLVGPLFAPGAPTEPSLKRWPLLRMARSTALTVFRSVRRAVSLGRWD